MRMLSTPSRRIRTRTGRSPLLRTNCAIHPRVPERGTASLLNVRTWSPGFIPATAAGDVSATESTVACVQLTESASWANERYSRGRLSIVPASRLISADARLLHASRLAADTERDIVKTAAFGKVIADLLDLLVAPLGFDSLGCQWRQFRNWRAGRANEAAGQ